jgi:hypothetical protein
MPVDDFLSLAPNQRRGIIEAGASASSWTADVLEKDAWVVWCLNALFRQADAPNYAFKGGTSLSKVYAVIDRFSEDVDITVSTNHSHVHPRVSLTGAQLRTTTGWSSPGG